MAAAATGRVAVFGEAGLSASVAAGAVRVGAVQALAGLELPSAMGAEAEALCSRGLRPGQRFHGSAYRLKP